MNKKREVARLVFDREDDMFVAFLAKPDTMEGRHPLGSMNAIFMEDPLLKEEFQKLMSSCAKYIVIGAFGKVEVSELVEEVRHE